MGFCKPSAPLRARCGAYVFGTCEPYPPTDAGITGR